jgi:hypothetical protein
VIVTGIILTIDQLTKRMTFFKVILEKSKDGILIMGHLLLSAGRAQFAVTSETPQNLVRCTVQT